MNRWCNESYKHTLRNDMIRQLFLDMKKDLNVSNQDLNNLFINETCINKDNII